MVKLVQPSPGRFDRPNSLRRPHTHELDPSLNSGSTPSSTPSTYDPSSYGTRNTAAPPPPVRVSAATSFARPLTGVLLSSDDPKYLNGLTLTRLSKSIIFSITFHHRRLIRRRLSQPASPVPPGDSPPPPPRIRRLEVRGSLWQQWVRCQLSMATTAMEVTIRLVEVAVAAQSPTYAHTPQVLCHLSHGTQRQRGCASNGSSLNEYRTASYECDNGMSGRVDRNSYAAQAGATRGLKCRDSNPNQYNPYDGNKQDSSFGGGNSGGWEAGRQRSMGLGAPAQCACAGSTTVRRLGPTTARLRDWLQRVP